MEEKFISHLSAAFLWEVPNIDIILGPEFVQSDSVEYTVTKRTCLYKKKGHKVHLCTAYMPADAIVMKNNLSLASPELLFLQLAPILNIHQLILLGLQLCSHPAGKPELSLTTTAKLSKFLRNTSWHRGHRKALRALKYIVDGSASVTESLAFMVLTLPHALGGYALKGASFNQEIKLKKEARKILKQKRCFLDLFYKSEKVAVEYDSYKYHRGVSEQERDMLRSHVLEKHGLKVLHMFSHQLFNDVFCKCFAFNLAYQLKRRIQNRAKKFRQMHLQFRLLLNFKRA